MAPPETSLYSTPIIASELQLLLGCRRETAASERYSTVASVLMFCHVLPCSALVLPRHASRGMFSAPPL